MLGITRGRLTAAVASLGLVGAVGGAAIGQTAQASGGLCSTGQVCIFNETQFLGELGWRGSGGGVENVGSGANDEMKSWQNKTTENARWYVNDNGAGACYNMPAGAQNSVAEYPDELSSWATDGSC